jgi:hypothetical protein
VSELDTAEAVPLSAERWRSAPTIDGLWANLSRPGRSGVGLALGDAGELLWRESGRSNPSASEVKLLPEVVQLWTPSRRITLRNAATDKGPVRQAVWGALAGRDAAWMDTTSTNLYFQDWRIYGYDGRTKTVRQLADSTELYHTAKLPIAPHDTVPVIADDRMVYWSAAVPDEKGRQGFSGDILGRDIGARGPVRTFAKNAFLPRVAGRTLYYVKTPSIDPHLRKGVFEIHAVSDGRDSVVVSGPLVKDQEVTGLAVAPTHIVWSIGATNPQADPSPNPAEGCVDRSSHGCALYVMPIHSTTVVRVALHSAGVQPVLGVKGSLLGWGSGTQNGDAGQYVMDMNSGAIWRLGQAPGCSTVQFAGQFVAASKSDERTGRCGITVGRWRMPR